MIKGWEIGIGGMLPGERAEFTIGPEYAYGEAGHPPKIPPNATLKFTIELAQGGYCQSFRWTASDDDLLKSAETKK